MTTDIFKQTIEMTAGQPVGEIQKTPLDELRRNRERKIGHCLRFATFFPWVGRGNMMRDRLVSHEEAEAAYDDAIRRLEQTR